ncbi:hypothetical protein [uncultured Paludibaculum sp.]|uniref:DUF4097 family beta strand repeat-containing protein n=1 Tax=uncultured Paludibaculum sp. TaxID=1765020 RepID=UPI002AAC11BA|nr:hypothetical protein [uncultured Paludibaculum sp.]
MTIRTISALGAAFLLATALAPAQEKKLTCEDRGNDSRHRICDMREMKMAYTGRLDVDAAPNGGIRITAWDRNEILVRAKVEAWGDSDSESRDRLNQVHVITSGSTVKADGPKSTTFGIKTGDQKWSVSYEAFVPRKIDLKLDSVNGGINVADVRGNLRFQTVNGGITLIGVNGTVKGETVNGGVHVDIAGTYWEGEGLEVETVNGGVVLSVPSTFAANVHAETVNGGMSTNFDGAVVEGKWGPKKMDLRIGAGGPKVSVSTVNGGVQIKKKA